MQLMEAFRSAHGNDQCERHGRPKDRTTILPAARKGGAAGIYGVRPEHLTIAEIGVPATVVVVEPTGSETHVLVKIGSAETTLVLRDRLHLDPGQPIAIAPDPAKIHLFSSEGVRLN